VENTRAIEGTMVGTRQIVPVTGRKETLEEPYVSLSDPQRMMSDCFHGVSTKSKVYRELTLPIPERLEIGCFVRSKLATS